MHLARRSCLLVVLLTQLICDGGSEATGLHAIWPTLPIELDMVSAISLIGSRLPAADHPFFVGACRSAVQRRRHRCWRPPCATDVLGGGGWSRAPHLLWLQVWWRR